MPNYFEIAENAAASLAETKVGSRLVQEASALARGLFGSESASAFLLEKSPALLEPKPAGLVAFAPRSLENIIKAFPESIPETLASSFETPGNTRIGTILTPKVDSNLGLGFRRLSEQWSTIPSFKGSKLGITGATGELSMPEVLISTEAPAQGAVASWANGKVFMGETVFRSPFNPETAGIAVHETTHHEQAFLAVCRKADQLGISSLSGDSKQLHLIMSELEPFHLGLSDSTVQKFLEFRAARQLTSDAASRAEQIISSNQELFDLPFQPNGLKSQLKEINNYKSLIADGVDNERAKAVLKQFLDPGEREAMLQRIFGYEGKAQAAFVNARIPAGLRAGAWGENQYRELQTVFQNTLGRAEQVTDQNKKIWMAVYQDALHEREARFNQFIAQESLADHLAGKGINK